MPRTTGNLCPKSNTDEQRSKFKFIDENGEPYDLRDLRKRGRPDRREDRPNMWFPVYFNKEVNSFSLERQSPFDIEITPKRGDGSDGRWRWGKERVGANLDILEARFTKKSEKWDISHRVYLNHVNATPIDGDDDLDEDEETAVERTSRAKSIWMGGELSTDVGRRTFKSLIPEAEIEYPKPVELLKRCVNYATGNDDIVLDFFAGSCTIAQAVLELNALSNQQRRFICVQLPEPFENEIAVDNGTLRTIADLGKLRIKRVIEKLVQQQQNNNITDFQGSGFRVFKLDTSNIRAWDPNPANLAQTLEDYIEHIKPDRSESDLLYELLLKLGLDLCVPIEIRQMGGNDGATETPAGREPAVDVNAQPHTVHSIGGGVLMVCLSRHIGQGDVEALAQGIVNWHQELAPATDTMCVFRDSAFADDVAKTNLAAILNQHGMVNIKSL